MNSNALTKTKDNNSRFGISQAMKKHAEQRKSDGLHVGRPKGAGSYALDELERQKDFIMKLNETQSINSIVKELEFINISVSRSTVYRFINSQLKVKPKCDHDTGRKKGSKKFIEFESQKELIKNMSGSNSLQQIAEYLNDNKLMSFEVTKSTLYRYIKSVNIQ